MRAAPLDLHKALGVSSIRSVFFVTAVTLMLTLTFLTTLAQADEGPVAYYPFNGNTNDESGNENHGTVYG